MRKSSHAIQEMDLFTDFPQEPPSDIFLHPIPHAVVQAVSSKPSSPAAPPKIHPKIDDFGARVDEAVARKDASKVYYEAILHAGEKNIDKLPLSKIWPNINYAKILEKKPELRFAFNIIRSLRDALPEKKGRFSFQRERFQQCLTYAQLLVKKVLDHPNPSDEMHVEDLRDTIQEIDNTAVEENNVLVQKYLSRFSDLFQLYDTYGHDLSLKDYHLVGNEGRHYYLYRYTGDPLNDDYFIILEGRNVAFGTSKEDCIQGFAPYYERLKQEQAKAAAEKTLARKAAQGQKKHVDFSIYSFRRPPHYSLCKKINGHFTEFVQFQTLEEARKYRAEHQDDLDKMYEDWKKNPPERPDIDIDSLHLKHHKGHVTTEEFDATFGFKCVKFGNYVNEEGLRQRNLDLTYDALIDLSNVLHIPPKALSLNGNLGLLFGCNGRGGKAAAHYETANVVINLTKRKGAGSLAHEWFHAVDHYFSRMESENTLALYSETKDMDDRASEKYKYHNGLEIIQHPPIQDTKDREAPTTVQKLREEIKDAMADIFYTIRKTDIQHRSEINDKKSSPYYSQNCEMGARCFEAVVSDILKEHGEKNPFLVSYTSEKDWYACTGRKESYPYPTEQELPYIRSAYENLISTMRYAQTEQGIALYSCDDYTHLTEMEHITSLADETELTERELALRDFAEEAFGMDTQFFHGSDALHGLYEPDSDTLYLNIDTQKPLSETLWHEAFHGLRKADERLYKDLLTYAEIEHPISREQIDAYKAEHHIQKMSDDTIREELLSDAFAKAKEREALLAKAPSGLSRNLLSYAISFKERVQGFFHERKGVLTSEQFHDFEKGIASLAKRMEKGHYNVKAGKILAAKGTSITSERYVSPKELQTYIHGDLGNLYNFSEEQQKQFDIAAATKLLHTFPRQKVKSTIRACSPFGKKSSYVRDVMQATELAISR